MTYVYLSTAMKGLTIEDFRKVSAEHVPFEKIDGLLACTAGVDGGGLTVVRALDRPILTRLGRLAGLEAPAPYVLAVEAEQPAPPGLRPAALPAEIPNNHLSYALTWFGLAGVLACFYGAKLAEWFRGP